MSRYPLFTLRSELVIDHRTLDPVCKVLAWSFDQAFTGLFPEQDAFDRPLDKIRQQYSGQRISGVLLGCCIDSFKTFRTVGFATFLVKIS